MGTGVITGNNTILRRGQHIAPRATVQIGNGGGVGDIGTAGVSNNSALVINRTGSLTIAGPVSGAGTLTNNNSGTATLTGPYSATGPIAVTAGTLAFGTTTAPRQTAAVLVTTHALSIVNPGSGTSAIDLTNHDMMITNNTPASSSAIKTWTATSTVPC